MVKVKITFLLTKINILTLIQEIYFNENLGTSHLDIKQDKTF